MLELIILYMLCKSVNGIAKRKELNSYKYVSYTILLWFGLEALFFILGIIFFRVPLLAYLFALIGAALGGFLAYQIVIKAPVQFTDYEEIK